MEEWEEFRYIDASVSTGSLASSEKSLLTRSSESSSIVDGIQGGGNKKHKSGLKFDGIELIRLQNGQNSAAAAVKKVKFERKFLASSTLKLFAKKENKNDEYTFCSFLDYGNFIFIKKMINHLRFK